MHALELFSGTKSWGKELERLGFNVVSLDINDYKGKFIPTHKCDILEWDYTKYPKNYFQVITASPPCVYYSKLQYTWLGRHKRDPITKELYLFTREILNKKRELADKWVMKTLEIIEYFSPKWWFIENPATGVLKNRTIMFDIPFFDVNYCAYGYKYKKPTRIWTNLTDFKPKVCLKRQCPSIIQYNSDNPSKKWRNKHMLNIGHTDSLSLFQKYSIPPLLIKDLLKNINT